MTDPEAFDAIMARADPPLVVVTTTNGRERAGCVVGFHAQSGIEPHSLSVWLSKANHTFRVATTADLFAVHFLTTQDRGSAELFGTHTGDDMDKFQRCSWHSGPDGVPLLDACPNRVVGRKIALLDTGDDHVCLVLHPMEATYAGEYTPLRVSDAADLDAGHAAEERPEPADARAPDAD
jgi:flavin reductase (DIM6/NTAB) family NADH-FMN oxidoreductase RutF